MTANTTTSLERDPRFWARKYMAEGFHVLPVAVPISDKVCSCYKGAGCSKPGKHPLTKWKGRPPATMQDVEGWQQKWPGKYGLGIMHDNVVAIDLDGDEGLASFARLLEENGGAGAFPVTRAQRSGGGGFHVLLRVPPEAKISNNNSGKLGNKIDVKFRVGYICAVPSPHKSGGQYEWVHLSAANEETGMDPWSVPIADCPPWLLAMLVDGGGAEGLFSGFDFDKWIATKAPAVQGQEGDAAAWSVCMYAAKSGILDDESFLERVSEWNARCSPPWEDAEILRKFHDAVGKVVEEGRIAVPLDKHGRALYSATALERILNGDAKYRGALRWNSFKEQALYGGVAFDDHQWTELWLDVMRRYGYQKVPREDVWNTALAACKRHPFNPLVDRLSGLVWDGEPRLEKAAAELLGVTEDGGLGAVYLKKWAIGCVARAFEPGCKLDVALVLSGRQGIGKSSWFREMSFGEFFSDTDIDLSSKDAYLQISGTWIYEWPELEAAWKVRESERVKSFLSSQVDKYRAPYERTTAEHPRRCVVVGTTNHKRVLHDSTGSRRFWILEVGKVDLGKTRGWRERLWAEAVSLYRAKVDYWLSASEETRRENLAERYTHTHPLYEASMEAIQKSGDLYKKQGYLRVADISFLLDRPFSRLNSAENRIIADALRASGFCDHRENLAGGRPVVWKREG